MKNNIVGILKVEGRTVRDVSEKLGIEERLLKYYIENPSAEIQLDIAKALAEEFNLPVAFLLGVPCKYRLSKLPHKDLEEDLQSAASEIRPYLEFKWRGGYYDTDMENPNSYKGEGFIAMSFDFKNPEICTIRDAFKEGIKKAGFIPKIVCDIASNNYITLEIFETIKKCKFLVLDTTYENYGAYYEAGFAKGLGKQVIICCKKKRFDKRKDHFDISQINHVLWENEGDLTKQLEERIRLTVE